MIQILFYIFASLAIISALTLVLSKNPVNSVIAMIFTFISTSAIWILFQQTYLALLLIVVYVGAVLVMFMFVVFMLDLHVEEEGRVGRIFYAFCAVIVCAIFATMISFAIMQAFSGAQMLGGTGSVKLIGSVMFSDKNLYIFELVDFILLAAMIAAVTLTLRGKRKDNKCVDAGKQVKVNAKDRLIMVKIPSNKENQEEQENTTND